MLVTHAYSQDRVITGTVTAKEDGLSLPGVSVIVKGTTVGTQTNGQGRYTLSVPANATQLEFRYIGYTNQTVSIGANSTVNVVLTLDSKQLGEVVITALGLEANKDKLGTSVSSVKGDAIAKSGETSLLAGLSGKASGVQVVRSGGDPGAGAYIQIRGQSTITGSTQPLFVIDGIPVSNSNLGSGIDGVVQQSRLSDINAGDIESMEVLKGAAAGALWGSRAANGVIIITTKKGRSNSGKLNVSLNTTYSMDELNREVPLQTSYGQGTGGIYRFNNSRSWGDKISDRTGGADVASGSAYFLLPDGSKRFAVASGTAANPHGGKQSQQVYDHATDLFENGYFLDNTLALSGSDQSSTFYLSLSNLDQNGTLKAGSDYHRRSARLNAEHKFGERVKLLGGLTYSNVVSDRAQQGSNISGIFLGGLRTSPDFNSEIYEGTYVNAAGEIFPNRQVSYRNQIGASTNSGYDNPLWILNKITNDTRVNRFLGNFEGRFDATNWLQFTARTGIDTYSDYRRENFPVLSASFPGGSLTVQEVSETQFNTDVFGRVKHSLNKDINFTGLVGFNYNNREFENTGATARSFILPDAPFDLGNSAAAARFPFNSNSTIRTAATYTQLTFDLYNQLYLDFTGRAENASTFANTFFYPSASLAWQFTELPTFKNASALSFGKLRASYGEVGVQPGPYQNSTYYTAAGFGESYGPALDASSDTYGGGYVRSGLQGNANLQPERVKEFEVGTDLRFFKDILSLSATYYNNKTEGAIFGVAVPATTGFTQRNDNAAELSNKGLEFDLGVRLLDKSDFSWNASANWSKNDNKVVDLKGVTSFFLNGFAGTSSRAVEGRALGVLWGSDFDRDASGKLVLDANGFPAAAPTESVLADPNPDWQAGITNTFRYKGIGLSILVDHVQGGQVWNGTRGALTTFGTAASTGVESVAPSDLKTYSGATIAAGTAFRGNISDFGAGPVALTEAWYTSVGGGFGPVASQFMEEGTRTRLREISLSYTLGGDKFHNATKLQSIDFSLTGRNLALWTDYTGIDPETNLTGPSNGRGLDYFNNPSTRSYLFSVKINY
ncbi:MAG: SusC/RagA family TonB-linked outer membrane protein [Daejeonella sp.]